jgi:hypothetical protein
VFSCGGEREKTKQTKEGRKKKDNLIIAETYTDCYERRNNYIIIIKVK